jgi:hypothetical protein
MKKKLVVVLMSMLITVTALPAFGTINEKELTETSMIEDIPIIDFYNNILWSYNPMIIYLENYGTGTAEDIEWEINITGGYFFSPHEWNGSFDALGEYNHKIYLNTTGLGFGNMNLYCKYKMQNVSGCDVYIEKKEEYRILSIFFIHIFIRFLQPKKDWITIDDVNYFNDTDQDGCHFFVEGINNMHNVRVMEGADDGSEEALFLAACKFTNGNATLYECGVTRSIVESEEAHWEIELVNDE